MEATTQLQELKIAVGTLIFVDPKVIVESKTNPRRTVKDASFGDLVASVAEQGVLQPVLVRPAGTISSGAYAGQNRYELVAGHRRVAAAREAALESVPCFVRDLDDKQALEIQVIENLQRSDLHPLEEAQGYRQLIDQHGYTPEQLADRVGKSKGYIYARLKLGALTPAAREPFLEGKVDASIALLIARLPVQFQDEATKQILAGGYEEIPQAKRPPNLEDDDSFQHAARPLTYREASRFVQRYFMLRLDRAPFDPKDLKLVPAAGACAACPKRTGNQPELFGDVKSADVCTDPDCFGKKREAAWRAWAAAEEAKGRKVLDDKEARKLFPYGDELTYDSPYIDLASPAQELQEYRKTYRGVLGKAVAAAPIAIVRDPRGGIHELIAKKDLPAVVKAAGLKVRAPSARSSGGDYAAKQARAAKIRKVKNRAMVLAVLEAAAKRDYPVDVLFPIVVESILSHSWHDVVSEVAKRRELTGRGEESIRKAIAAEPEKTRPRLQRELLFELLATRGCPGSYSTELAGTELRAAAKAFGLDLSKVAARALAEASKKKAPAKKKAKRG